MTGVSSIHSLADDERARARAEAAAWARFSSTADAEAFWGSWLAILCLQIEQVRGGCVLLETGAEGAYGIEAVWPDASRDMQYLAATAQRALSERRGIAVAPDGESAPGPDRDAYVGYPVVISGVLYGAVVLHLGPRPVPELQHALRMVHWGSAWPSDRFRQRQLLEGQARLERLALVSELAAVALQARHSRSAALAVANELVARLACERVSIGFDVAGSMAVHAISHTATFDGKMGAVRLLAEAMDEVLDLDVALVYPAADADGLAVIAHAELARDARDTGICSVPLVDEGHTTGVLTLERSGGVLDADEVELCKTLGLQLGPVFALKFERERSSLQRLRLAAGGAARALFGPRHPGFKLGTLLLPALLGFFSLVSSEYRVAAQTVIEGAVQRAVVAPFDGFIVESLARAGDTVSAGQVLSRLDDRDLRLEQIKWGSERLQLLRRQRQALAEQNNAELAIIAAQIRQIEAQIALVDEQLARSVLAAPFDGVVVSGDLSQLLGTPVDKGQALFEVALLDRYRVILKVDERDIANLRVDQPGQLAMFSLPGQTLPFVVRHITPVSTAEDGRNFFRVEAEISADTRRLRPGMEGVGKVLVGERKLIWIWTHRLVDWLRLWVWNWQL